MARIFQDGFEMGRPGFNRVSRNGTYDDSLWILHASSTLTNTEFGARSGYGSSGNYGFYIHCSQGSSFWIERTFNEGLMEHFGRAEFARHAYGGDSPNIIGMFDDNGGIVASIRADDQGDLAYYIGNTEVGRTSNITIVDVFARIEWRLRIGTENGVFEVKINGNSLFSWQGDTQGENLGEITKLRIGCWPDKIRGTWDDIAINDTTGTVNNSWVGKGSILLLKPKGAGNYSQFTPNEAGNNWEKVNEVPNDGDTTYVESENAEEIDTYEMEELIADHAIDPDSIVKAVQVCFTGRYEGTDAHLAPMLRSGVTDEEGDKKTLASSYHRLFQQVFNVNPSTTEQWTHEEVDALEAGVKHKEHAYD